MKQHLASIATVLVVLPLFACVRHWASGDPVRVNVEMEQIQQLNTALAKGGIAAMLDIASRESIAAPKINSKYYAERITKQESALAPLEQAKRAFGLRVAQSLDEVAAELQKPASSERRAEQAKQLLDLAQWLKAEKGYGNYILVIRCENLSAVPLAYLVADLSFPMEKITTLFNRIMPSADERAFRKVVLNSEAPKPFIGNLVGTESAQDEQMQRCWGRQWGKLREWLVEHKLVEETNRDALPDELAFFVEEPEAKPFTTTRNWEVNRHSTLVNGLRDKELDNLAIFAKYRELVGWFPTEPPKWWKPGDPVFTKTRAAFEDAWSPYLEKYGPLYGTAARVYEQVKSGTFMDWETQLEKRAASAKPQ